MRGGRLLRHAGSGWLMAAALLTGCSHLPPAPPAPSTPAAAPLSATEAVVDAPGEGLGGSAVRLPGWAERIQHLALQEWALWGRVRWQLPADRLERPRGAEAPTEADAAFTSRVLQYWSSAVGSELTESKLLFPDGSLQAWSAAFITHLARGAGLGADSFPSGRTHWGYIRASLEQPRRSGFAALDASQTAPQLADVICAPREVSVSQFKQFAQLGKLSRQERERAWPFHCDLVVAISPTALGAIGGNVQERVVWTDTPLDAQGRLLPLPQRPWLLILRRAESGNGAGRRQGQP
ncbi:DUF2272 domain-containing protein [Roseateles aquae]|nr:DUF2272 domain-containing protein [Paucibacter sp. APW11]